MVPEVGGRQRGLLALSMRSANKVISCDRWIDEPLAGQPAAIARADTPVIHHPVAGR